MLKLEGLISLNCICSVGKRFGLECAAALGNEDTLKKNKIYWTLSRTKVKI